MNRSKKRGTVATMLAAMTVLVFASADAATRLMGVDLSPDVTTQIDALTVSDHSVVRIGPVNNVSILPLGALPDAAAIDALHINLDDSVWLSFDSIVELGGATVFPADVVAWNGSSYALVFDGLANGLPAGSNLDALSNYLGQLVFSVSVSTTLSGTTFADEDLIRFNGSGFVKHFDGLASGLDSALDVDAAHALPNGNVLVSFDTGGSVGAHAFEDADVLEYSGSGWESSYEASRLSGLETVDIEAFYATADSDGDGASDSNDNCVLAPNPSQRDTDGDGIGNICDADLDNDCIVNVSDLGILRLAFFRSDADADLNGDGVVNIADLGIFRLLFFQVPGPSGIPNLCVR